MIDRFVQDHLPPPAAQPEFLIDAPELALPAALNAAAWLLARALAAGDGDRPAVISDRTSLSYAELDDRSSRIARLLVEREGLVPGNRVLLVGRNTVMLAAAWLGIVKAGGIVVAAMPMLRAGELETLIARAAITHAIIDTGCREGFDGLERPGLKAWFHDGDAGTGALEAAIEATAPGFPAVATRADDPALIAFTSGTTGTPKATVHYHRDLIYPAICFAGPMLGPQPGEVWTGTPPLAFTFGLGGMLLFPLYFRGTALMLADISPAGVLAAIARHRVNHLFTAPTAYKAMLANLQSSGLAGHDLSSLRCCISAGEHLPAATWQAWHDATGLRLVNGIGATEMMHIFISASGDAIRPGATGRVLPHYRACVLDEDGRPQASGAGRLAVKGPTGCRYLDDPRQARYVVDGWNVTGDSYILDADGYFWYQARADDMIVSSGYNIAPPEVEAALLGHPAVAECAVVGVPDEARGTVVKAIVVPAAGAAAGPDLARALQDHVKAAIAPYKYPRRIEFAASLPRTATGKLQRHLLRDNS
jgi:2-aminobenzoate-CoA ligase